MSKICPLCQTMCDDSLKFCSNCGALLTDNSTSTDNTVKQKTEAKSDSISWVRSEAEKIISIYGCIHPFTVDLLHALAWQHGVSNADFKKIITEVCSKDQNEDNNESCTQLSTEDASLIVNIKECISTHNYNYLESLFSDLTAIAERTDNDKVQYLYYLSTAIFEADKCMKRYEDAIDHNEPYDTYWGTFWATVCFLQFVDEEGENYASKFFNLFDPNHFHRPKDDKYLLEAFYNLLHKERKTDPKDALDKITGDLSSQLKPFLRALECYTSEEEADCLEVRFYMNQFLSRFCLDEKLHRNFVDLPYEEKPAEESKEKQKALQNQKKDLENEEEFELTDIRLETDGKNKLFIYCSCVAPTLKGFEGKTVTLDCHILVNGKEIRKEGTLIDNGIASYKIKKFVVETDARELSLPVRGDNTLIYHLKVTYTPADKLLSKPQVLASTGANVGTVYYLYNIFSSNKMIIK